MELFSHLALGFAVAFTPDNLFYCFMGALLGTLIGVLPGLGPAATIAILLPLTYTLTPTGALIMLAGIYYGSQYGGSTTAILVNLPGESSSVVTALDGYQMARQNRAGAALLIAALGSFFAGCVATLLVAAVATPLSRLALSFQAPDYFALMVLGLIAAVVMAHGSVVKAIAMVMVGLVFGLIGIDVYSGLARMTYGYSQLADGVDFVPMAMGLFGIAEILRNLEAPPENRDVVTRSGFKLWLTRDEARRSVAPVLRGTVLGSLLGILPGSGAALSSFSSYALEKRVSRYPEKFGTGVIEGVAGPESANNAGAQTSFIPMLTLGIPSNAVMALMIGAMMIHGITPGPLVMQSNADLFWGLIASMWIGNAMLVIINLPMIGLWVQMLRIPYRLLFPTILLICSIGVYTLNNSTFDIYVFIGFSILGYIFYKLEFEPAPFLLGFVLGPLLEENFRRAMLLARGDATVFFTRPLSLSFLLVAAALVALALLPMLRRKREEIFVAEDE